MIIRNNNSVTQSEDCKTFRSFVTVHSAPELRAASSDLNLLSFQLKITVHFTHKMLNTFTRIGLSFLTETSGRDRRTDGRTNRAQCAGRTVTATKSVVTAREYALTVSKLRAPAGNHWFS